MKPSERIHQLMQPYKRQEDWTNTMIVAILDYLNEQHAQRHDENVYCDCGEHCVNKSPQEIQTSGDMTAIPYKNNPQHCPDGEPQPNKTPVSKECEHSHSVPNKDFQFSGPHTVEKLIDDANYKVGYQDGLRDATNKPDLIPLEVNKVMRCIQEVSTTHTYSEIAQAICQKFGTPNLIPLSEKEVSSALSVTGISDGQLIGITDLICQRFGTSKNDLIPLDLKELYSIADSLVGKPAPMALGEFIAIICQKFATKKAEVISVDEMVEIMRNYFSFRGDTHLGLTAVVTIKDLNGIATQVHQELVRRTL